MRALFEPPRRGVSFLPPAIEHDARQFGRESLLEFFEIGLIDESETQALASGDWLGRTAFAKTRRPEINVVVEPSALPHPGPALLRIHHKATSIGNGEADGFVLRIV